MNSTHKSYSIQELCVDIVGGGTPSTKVSSYWNGDIPWISSADVSDLGKISVSRFITKEAIENSATNIVPKGAIIIVSRVGVGKAAIAPFDLCFSQDCQGLILRKELVTEQFFIKVVQTSLKSLTRKARGATITGVTKEDIKKLTVSIPSIEDQAHIANILTKAENLISQRKESISLLDEYLKSTFLEIFGNPFRNERNWTKSAFEMLVAEDCPLTYGIVQPGDEYKDGVPIVRPVDLSETVVRKKHLKKIDPRISTKFKRTILKGDEILMCVRGTTGIVSLASKELKGCNVSRGIVPIWFGQDFNTLFAFNLLRSKAINSEIQRLTYGATLKQINLSDLRKVELINPPIELQREFAGIVEKIEGLKAQYQSSLQEFQNLYASLSQKAFKGELQFKADTKVIPLRPDEKEEDYFKKRKALACYIINQSLDDDKFGDTKFEKLLNLSDQYAIQRNLGQTYYQKVAGPYDNEFTKLFYIQIAAEKLYKRKRRGNQSVFIPDINHKKTFTADTYFSNDELSRVDKLITYFKKYTYEEPEIISTLYAVWNNRIIRQQQITDEALKQDFLDWDEKKRKYKNRLDAALAWMKKENIIPNGWGKLIEKPKGKQRKLVVGKKRTNSKRAS